MTNTASIDWNRLAVRTTKAVTSELARRGIACRSSDLAVVDLAFVELFADKECLADSSLIAPGLSPDDALAYLLLKLVKKRLR